MDPHDERLLLALWRRIWQRYSVGVLALNWRDSSFGDVVTEMAGALELAVEGAVVGDSFRGIRRNFRHPEDAPPVRVTGEVDHHPSLRFLVQCDAVRGLDRGPWSVHQRLDRGYDERPTRVSMFFQSRVDEARRAVSALEADYIRGLFIDDPDAPSASFKKPMVDKRCPCGGVIALGRGNHCLRCIHVSDSWGRLVGVCRVAVRAGCLDLRAREHGGVYVSEDASRDCVCAEHGYFSRPAQWTGMLSWCRLCHERLDQLQQAAAIVVGLFHVGAQALWESLDDASKRFALAREERERYCSPPRGQRLIELEDPPYERPLELGGPPEYYDHQSVADCPPERPSETDGRQGVRELLLEMS